jgi:hypothetical protein
MLNKKSPKIGDKVKLLPWKKVKKTRYYDSDVDTVCELLQIEWDIFYLYEGLIVGKDVENINIHSDEDCDIEFIIDGVKIVEAFPKEVFKILK